MDCIVTAIKNHENPYADLRILGITIWNYIQHNFFVFLVQMRFESHASEVIESSFQVFNDKERSTEASYLQAAFDHFIGVPSKFQYHTHTL